MTSNSGGGGALVVDFQAFRGARNEFILKELAAIDVRTGRYDLVLFAPPYEKTQLHPKQIKTNDWLERHYHRIQWNAGNIPYKDMVCIIARICSTSTVIYVKGLEKANFLRQYYHHGEVIDLNDIKAPLIPKSFIPSVKCPVPHQSDTTLQCALRKSLFYRSWLTLEKKN